MKLNKKIVGLSIAGLTIAAAIPAIAITLTSCGGQNKVGDFYDSFNSPYKELDMYAQTMDAAGLKLVQTSDGSSNQEGKQRDNSSQPKSFKEIADQINSSMKEYVGNLAKTPGIKDLTENKNTTVLFVKNDALTFNNSLDKNKKLSAVNKFQMEQPILYSQIYSTPDFEECPGFGFKFPAPINSKSNSLFDNWFEVGASQLSNEGDKSQVPNRLASSWKGTADFVFYLYDSEKMSIEDQKSLVSYINGFSADPNSDFLPARMLKPNGVTQHVIPLDIQWMYDGIWDQVGSFTIDYLFAQIFNNINTETKNIKWFYNLNFQKNQKNNNSDIDVKTVNDIAEQAKWNPHRFISSKNKDGQNQPEYKLGVARPVTSGQKDAKVNFATTMFNTTGHALSLGVNPDYISMNVKKSDNNYHYLAGYLRPYLDVIAPESKTKDQYDKFFSLDSSDGFPTWLQSHNVYALADNRDTFGNDQKTPWPLNKNENKTKAKTYSFDGIVDLTHETSPTDSSVLNVVKPVYTERNDSSATQAKATNVAFVYDSKTNKAITVNTWKEQQ